MNSTTAVAGVAVVATLIGAAVVANKRPNPAPVGGGGNPLSPASPALPSTAQVLSSGGLPPLASLPDQSLVDVAPNGMTATAIYSTEGGGLVDLANVNPVTGEYDAVRIALSKPAGAGFPAILVSKRGSQIYAKNVTLGGAAPIMNLAPAQLSRPTPTSLQLTSGPSHMNIFVGLRVKGDTSPNVTAVGFGDDRQPMTKAQSNVAPDTAFDLDRDAQREFGGIAPLVS